MAEKAGFSLKQRNPDVLTSIANLSNDEVFTPPSFANQMLDTVEDAWAESNDGAIIWEDKNVTFLDPFTKSGVFLREITSRLSIGLQKQIPDNQERVNHILTKQVFGVAITELTALLARRSVYCTKYANGKHSICTEFDTPQGNIWFERTEHTWVGGKEKVLTVNDSGNEVENTTDGTCKFCGARRKDYERGSESESYAYALIHIEDPRTRVNNLFGEDMHFDVIVGNPPYQLGSSGGDSVGGFAMPVYQQFVSATKALNPRFAALVIPSRWFGGGRGLDDFRKEMLADQRIRKLIDFPDSADVFPGVQIKGGVCHFLFDNQWNGDCEVLTFLGGQEVGKPMSRSLDQFDIFVRWNQAIPILEKVLAHIAPGGTDTLASIVSPIQPFSIRTSFRGSHNPRELSNPVKLYQNGGTSFIEREEIPRNKDWVEKWKVLIGSAYGAGDGFPHQIINHPIIAEPGSACTETYLVVGRFDSEAEARALANYLRTRFVRFLISLRKTTQHLFSERFSFVPLQDSSRDSTDKELYAKYKLTEEEIEFIESMIRPMELGDA